MLLVCQLSISDAGAPEPDSAHDRNCSRNAGGAGLVRLHPWHHARIRRHVVGRGRRLSDPCLQPFDFRQFSLGRHAGDLADNAPGSIHDRHRICRLAVCWVPCVDPVGPVCRHRHLGGCGGHPIRAPMLYPRRICSSACVAGIPCPARTSHGDETRDCARDRPCLRGAVVVSYPTVADRIGEPQPCAGGEEATRSPATRRHGCA